MLITIGTIEYRRQLGYRYQTVFKFVHLIKSHAQRIKIYLEIPWNAVDLKVEYCQPL